MRYLICIMRYQIYIMRVSNLHNNIEKQILIKYSAMLIICNSIFFFIYINNDFAFNFYRKFYNLFSF